MYNMCVASNKVIQPTLMYTAKLQYLYNQRVVQSRAVKFDAITFCQGRRKSYCIIITREGENNNTNEDVRDFYFFLFFYTEILAKKYYVCIPCSLYRARIL